MNKLRDVINYLPSGDDFNDQTDISDKLTVIQKYLCGDIHDGNETTFLLIMAHVIYGPDATQKGNNIVCNIHCFIFSCL